MTLLQGNRSLLILTLRNNAIPDSGGSKLRDVLLANQALLELDLSDNQFRPPSSFLSFSFFFFLPPLPSAF